MSDLFKGKLKVVSINPMVRIHGEGPKGAYCKGCMSFCREMRKASHICVKADRQSAHSGDWPACSKFQDVRTA